MNRSRRSPIFPRLRQIMFGKTRDLNDERIFHNLTLVAFFAWIGLGSDGLSSSCYGPDEAYRFLGQYHSLAVFVAIGIVLTIIIISSSYSQIIKLFPSGGGGYKVVTKLLLVSWLYFTASTYLSLLPCRRREWSGTGGRSGKLKKDGYTSCLSTGSG